jgi:hypothetical protein
MTDMTTDTASRAGTQSQDDDIRARYAHAKTEFMVYFAIIFLATLPLAFLTWVLAAIRSRSLTDRGPVARAWSQARIITPMIFSA